MNELKRRKIIRAEDTVEFDRGSNSYWNYALGAREYKVVPLIFPKKTFQTEKIISLKNYPFQYLHITNTGNGRRPINSLVQKLREVLNKGEEYLPLRSIIEDLFKVAKGTFALQALHRYLCMSVTKFVAMNVLLPEAIVLEGVNQKNYRG